MGNTMIAYAHTSGHASAIDLRAFAAVRPIVTVPVQGVKWDRESRRLGLIRRVADAAPMDPSKGNSPHRISVQCGTLFHRLGRSISQ